VLDLALAKISESDKRTIIWNFMEELWENYLNALEYNLPTKFNFMDFFNFGILKDGFSENDKNTGTKVSVTKKGLEEFQKDTHDWDIHT